MMYKLEVLSAAAQRKEHYFESLEEVLNEKERIKGQLETELKEALAEHYNNYDCKDLHCQVSIRLKKEYFVKFRISIARWEVIG